LEEKYPGFPGLNLSYEVREGLMKHFTAWDNPEDTGEIRTPSLEAQVANVADEIAYYSHDLDDGLDSGLLAEDKLAEEVPLWRQSADAVQCACAGVPDECRRYFIIRCLIDGQVRDVVLTTEKLISAAGVLTVEEVRRQPNALVQYSPDRERLNRQLRTYLYANLYHNPVVHEPNARAVLCIEKLFDYFLAHLDEIGDHARRRLEKVGAHRAVCDYLAGMTDRYVFQEYERFFGPIEPAILQRRASPV
jgi:dGTPase